MGFFDFLNRLLGDPNEKELKRLWPLVHEVRRIQRSPEIQTLQLPDFPRKTEEFKDRVRRGESLDALLPEAFATGVHACELLQGQKVQVGRLEFPWDMVPFDVQILGGVVLHRGMIAEMKTGEGKTLVCTLPVYLNALMGRGVHVVTVNDYLARRDSSWMGLLYKALGLSVGCIVHGLSNEERKAAYACDVTYGTNNEFGFDYLRDNMAISLSRQVQSFGPLRTGSRLHYAIVDEVDSILIDEARTPLIISQSAEESTQKYMQYAQLVKQLQEGTHFTRDEKMRTAVLTEEGIKKMEEILGLENIYTEKGFEEVHHIEQALRAHAIYKRDVDYVVKEGEVIIVDEFTGRLMPGRRYSHGLHQAIEAREGVEVQRESKTLATITFQNYFRLFEKLAGMTGTAKTEDEEFESIYKLRVIVVPTHKPMIRADKSDAVYRTAAGKFKAVAKIAQEKFEKGQPVLIGTTSIEKSEVMSALLQEMKIPHQVLNAKHHEKEAEIIALAGQKGAVTIATNMAGRGTDIKLGAGVTALEGLCILGTERHEARRIDNQLRGRSGRQGDMGESQFFVSMEDDLMRLFGGDRLKVLMQRLQVPDDVPLENAMVSRSIEGAQKKVEGHNFDIRRHVLQYDDVMNTHREIIYKRRRKTLEKIVEAEKGISQWPLHEEILEMIRKEIEVILDAHAQDIDPEQWDLKEVHNDLSALHAAFGTILMHEKLSAHREREKLQENLMQLLLSFYEEKCKRVEPEAVARAEAIIMLRSMDAHWMDHIDDMSHLREQVAFAGYAQRDPLIEYQDQGFQRFQQLLAAIRATTVRTLLQADFSQFLARVVEEEEEEEELETNIDEIEAELTETGVSVRTVPGAEKPAYAQRASAGRPASIRGPLSSRVIPKVGRNDPCPCGSRRKYKKCHGR